MLPAFLRVFEDMPLLIRDSLKVNLCAYRFSRKDQNELKLSLEGAVGPFVNACIDLMGVNEGKTERFAVSDSDIVVVLVSPASTNLLVHIRRGLQMTDCSGNINSMRWLPLWRHSWSTSGGAQICR